jgi:hypothetical protein
MLGAEAKSTHTFPIEDPCQCALASADLGQLFGEG